MKVIYLNFVRNRDPLALGVFAVWSVLNVALNFWDAPWKGLASAAAWWLFFPSAVYLIDFHKGNL